jgi:hypothetical protein
VTSGISWFVRTAGNAMPPGPARIRGGSRPASAPAPTPPCNGICTSPPTPERHGFVNHTGEVEGGFARLLAEAPRNRGIMGTAREPYGVKKRNVTVLAGHQPAPTVTTNPDDFVATFNAIRSLDPLSVFHKPINIRADNIRRIAGHARRLGVCLQTDVFATRESWQNYAIQSLLAMKQAARQAGLAKQLHLSGIRPAWAGRSNRSLEPTIYWRKCSMTHGLDTDFLVAAEVARVFPDGEAAGDFLAWLATARAGTEALAEQ